MAPPSLSCYQQWAGRQDPLQQTGLRLQQARDRPVGPAARTTTYSLLKTWNTKATPVYPISFSTTKLLLALGAITLPSGEGSVIMQ
eukprot:scaffold240865_cov30-Prasinocladus_malaysianus.AAC.2